jgi:L-arabinose transport system substrate-binding protein
MRFNKRSFLVAIVLCLGFIPFGCDKQSNSASSTTQPDNSHVVIGFIVKMPDQPWFQNEWKFAQQAADKDGFTLVKLGGTDGEQALSQIDNLSAQGAQGIIICTPDVRLGPAIVSRADKYGMKVFSVDDRFIDSSGNPMDEHHMGISARAIGQMVGDALWDEMQKRGWNPAETAAAIPTYEELPTAHDRTDGAIEELVAKGFPKDRIFTSPQKQADMPSGRDAANILLVQHQDVKNWLSAGMNDEAVLGTVRAMEDHGYTADHIIGIGIGGDTGVSDFEKPSPTGFFASVLISPKRHGFETAEYMYHWIHDGVEPPKETLTTGILITRDNYQEVRKEQGLD